MPAGRTEVLQTLPETPERVQRELAIQLALGPVSVAIKGHASPEMQRTYGRVQALCHQVGDTPQHFLALWGLYLVHLVQGKLQTTRALAGVNDTGDCYYEAELHRLKGTLLLRQPVLDESQAEAFFHQALAIARRQQARSWELRAAMSLARL